MVTVIAVTNQKGGVGKTTTVLNVAGALAATDATPLVVDLDPQGYASEGAGVAEGHFRSGADSLFDALDQAPAGPTLNDLAIAGEEFDIIPANIKLTAHDIENRLANQQDGRRNLQEVLERSDLSEYDIVLVDCPPRLGPLTDSALLACDAVVIPTQPRHTARRSLELLAEQIETLADHYDEAIPVAGIVANEARHDGVSDELVDWLDEEFGDIPVWEIRKRVAIDRAYEAARSLHAHDEQSDMEAVYEKIAEHLLELHTADTQEVPVDG